MVTLSAVQGETLGDLIRLWPNQEFTLIGAMALRLLLPGYDRQTNDIDITLILPPDAVRARLRSLPGWASTPGVDHEWRSPHGGIVHVIPITAEDLRTGEMTWPQSGRRMSVVGMRLAFEHRAAVAIGRGVSVPVATVPSIVVLKAVSYQDRPGARERDLGDIAEAMEKYVPDDDDRRWSGGTETLPYEDISPYLLGRDVRAISKDEEFGSVRALIARIGTESDGGRAQAAMLQLGPPPWRGRPDELLGRLDAFRRGLEA